ncbi:prolyl oligopeptidase family serine peptidase [Colwellia hornerae]|uniref:S9 family peptidase n=1 Tax=Colwellia hornerae TaxID=89402 RepID=A0A5C6QMG0_9GAMM|nr:prolyl oligopeptidase family serine peptidase [Colwellia hornerae]TWX53728.1 S9 family peptidase [Colwellia hornerae]TWX60378.1 S9 family peptidase [Colwellia hornerae]TWX70134.1 S9 family peptidase [Colwellia hornerae]
MSVLNHPKKTLLLCAALSLTACQNDKEPNKAPVMKVENPDKTISYDILGKTDQDHLYLEEVLGEQALTEVKSWNTRTLDRLMADPLFEKMNSEVLEIVNSKDKIPYASYRNGEVHNFWQDEQHERGIWRKSTMSSYLSDTPVWQTVLDFDALSKSENKNWVYKGNNCLSPDYEICMVSLSDGGKDAVIQREFNTKTQTFVTDGFITQESKGSIDWLDKNTLIIGVDFGENTMTTSGYPMVSKLWQRGTPLSSAVEIDRGKQTDVGYWGGVTELSDGRREIITTRALTFYDTEYYWFPRKSDGSISEKIKLPIPKKSNLSGEFKGQMIVKLNEDWRGFKLGDLVSFNIDNFIKDGKIDLINLVFSPDEKSSIGNFGVTKSKVLMSIYHDVTGSAYQFDWHDNKWTAKKLDFPSNGSVSIGSTNSKEEIAFISAESFLDPDTLYTYNTATGKKAKAKSLPSWFDAASMISEQFFVSSTDGTQVPYFVVRHKNTTLDGKNPTLLYGYGGFEVSLNPSYSATRGKLWLERGGVYVLANIRGGGEYGPKWHQAGLKTNRQRIYDDFIAVAEDLIAKKITSPEHLGIEGGSNGGLLMGVMFTQRPDLFNAVICAVPLLDMMRYHTLLAGASWMGEYGDPENEIEGKFLRSISPYHNIDPGVDYPEVFFITSTKDDRVHPGHARKVAKRMEDQGHKFLYYENIDGGHSAAANLKETAKRIALQHTYLMQKLASN